MTSKLVYPSFFAVVNNLSKRPGIYIYIMTTLRLGRSKDTEGRTIFKIIWRPKEYKNQVATSAAKTVHGNQISGQNLRLERYRNQFGEASGSERFGLKWQY